VPGCFCAFTRAPTLAIVWTREAQIETIIMYHNLEVPGTCQTLWQTCHALVPGLLKNCAVKTEDLKIIASKPIDPQSTSVYLIKDGTINETFDGRLIVVHESGDLIGADGLLQHKITAYENDFAVTVDEYNGSEFIDAIFGDKGKLTVWTQYLTCLSQSYQLLMCHFSQQDPAFNPEYRHYNKGDMIIEANTEGDEVFTLMSGSAKVMNNNTEVGVINKDELFGAIAALTNTKRTASIIAASNCETIVVKSESFRGLLATRPNTVQKLITDMARTVVSCNDKIIELSKRET